jgi:hypothetical protein
MRNPGRDIISVEKYRPGITYPGRDYLSAEDNFENEKSRQGYYIGRKISLSKP